MKNKKLLVLLPAVALMLAGCGNPSDDDHSGSDTSTSDTSGSTTGSTTNTGSTGSTGTTDTSGGQSLPDGVTEADFGTASAPITLAQAKALIDKLGLSEPEENATVKFEKLPIYLKGTVISNSALSDGEVNFLNMKDGDIEFTGMYSVFADGVTGYDAQNSMAGKKATVKGYGALYKKNGAIKYELVKANSEKVTILKVEDSGEHHAEPAKLPKTLAELTTVTPGRAQAYTSTAKIKSWADNKGNPTSTKTQYGNLILEDDASHELFAYGASATASMLTWNDSLGEYNTAANPKDFLTNDLTKDLQVGDTINFWCVVYLFKTTREADVIITSKVTPTPESVVFSEDAYNLTVGQDLDLSTLVTLTPSGSGTLNYEIVGGTSEYATLTNSSLHGDAAGDVTVKVSVAGTELNDTAVVHVNPLVPESVHFDEDELNLYVGEELDLRSHAVLNPADSGELSYSITAGDSFATLDGYTLTGTADGDVTVKVEVAGYPTLNDTITVHVSTAATGAITDIQSTGSSKTMYIDGTDDEKTVTFEVVVTSNGTRSEGVVWEITSGSEFVTISYEDFPGDDTHCVVTLKEGVETTGFVEIVAKAADHPTDYHVEHDVTIDQHVAPNPYGTLEDPLTISEAEELLTGLGNKVLTPEKIYVSGIVSASHKAVGPSTYNTVWLTNDDGSVEQEFELYSTKSDIEVAADGLIGKRVVAYGWGELFNTTFELTNKDKDNNYDNPFIKSITDGGRTATSVSLPGDPFSIAAGGEKTISATTMPYGSVAEITYTVSPADQGVSYVNGKVVAESTATAGDYTLTASVAGCSDATLGFTVTAEATSYSFATHDYVQANSSPYNSYASDKDLEIGGITWNITGNLAQDPWRFGGKDITAVDRKMYSKTALSFNASTITLAVGTANITVNGIHVGVYSTAELAAAGGTGDVADFSKSYTANTSIVCTKADTADWNGKYICISFNVTYSAKDSNKYVQLVSLAIE